MNWLFTRPLFCEYKFCTSIRLSWPSFEQVAMVREKQNFFKVKEKSGKVFDIVKVCEK